MGKRNINSSSPGIFQQMNEKQALIKLTAMCSKSEHSSGEIEETLQKWELPEEVRQRIINYLKENKYVDDVRFTRAFANDKLKYNHWGRKKIEHGLYLKHVPKSMFQPVLDEIPDQDYIDILSPLLKKKWESIKGKTDYERSMKLIRYAVGRGFTLDLIKKCIDIADFFEND